MTAASAVAQSVDLSGMGFDRGNSTAPITIVEFGDFGCSACGIFARETFAQFEREFIQTGRVRWKYVPFVLGSFPNSAAVTRAALCAAEQDAFWSMHDLLYQRQREWAKMFGIRAQLEKYAGQLKLNAAAFNQCYNKDNPAATMRRNDQAAATLMIRATPTFFINGQRAVGALSMEQWRRVIEIVSARK
jgi:protein-disulfide isomerase